MGGVQEETLMTQPKVKPIPGGYSTMQPYLIVKNCAAAIEFYKKAFGVTERMRATQPDGRVAHAEIQVGDSVIMMADEHPEVEAFSPQHYGGSPVSLHIYVEDCDAAYRQAIAAGGKTVREPADQHYGDRNAGVLDPFGYKWWLSTHVKDVSQEELAKAQ
jgi:PhnB protein